MREGMLEMSEKERERLRVMDSVKGLRIRLKKAAELIGVSYRQSKRIYRRYREEGDKGLVHRSRGRVSNRRKDPIMREKVLERYRERYEGFGPTLASEKLEKEGYKVHDETLRLWLLEEGLWVKKRKRGKHRSWRERKEHRGEMVQMDGSMEDWFEGRGEEAVLMDMVDDATGEGTAEFHEGETTRAAMLTLWGYIDENGIPVSLYVDRDTIYVSDRQATVGEDLKGEKPLTQFGSAVKKLGIKIILALSPQAKGRVERRHGVLQDRLIKEMRLEEISTRKEGNAFLKGGFLKEMNRRFSVEPKSDVDFHRPIPEGLDLRTVFCFEEERVVDNDWTIRWKNRIFQIMKGNRVLPPARKKVTVQELLEGRVHIVYRGEEVAYEEIARKPAREKKPVDISGSIRYYKPSADHPWRRYKNRPMLVASPR
ncbi:MAG: ISNCY family transposase [Candidatus Aureabacteria bacterium]|nr:ISNCY family transposase [Candidatus Auribacterota bacterium]